MDGNYEKNTIFQILRVCVSIIKTVQTTVCKCVCSCNPLKRGVSRSNRLRIPQNKEFPLILTKPMYIICKMMIHSHSLIKESIEITTHKGMECIFSHIDLSRKSSFSSNYWAEAIKRKWHILNSHLNTTINLQIETEQINDRSKINACRWLLHFAIYFKTIWNMYTHNVQIKCCNFQINTYMWRICIVK